ncbi:peptide deformylase [Candidatus Saganbacteria bacterium]|nr:peptide deformylase [Candidatus Saganbacteria bacterium]
MKRKIVRFPSPLLRKKAKAIKRVTPEIRKLANDMMETMHAVPGVGLAGPQVGELLRLIVADIGAGEIILANPKLVNKKGKREYVEGCLSLPGVEAPVTRADCVVVKGLDLDNQPVEIAAEGLMATVLQHEIDHLDGFVFIDRVEDPSTIKHVAANKEPKETLI